jgi:protein farnesyltransferase subunit beta
LQRNSHVAFLAKNFIQGFPSKYTSQDASQPWLMYWILQSFSCLQVGLDPGNKQKSVSTRSSNVLHDINRLVFLERLIR